MSTPWPGLPDEEKRKMEKHKHKGKKEEAMYIEIWTNSRKMKLYTSLSVVRSNCSSRQFTDFMQKISVVSAYEKFSSRTTPFLRITNLSSLLNHWGENVTPEMRFFTSGPDKTTVEGAKRT
jgi:hypothetical protein